MRKLSSKFTIRLQEFEWKFGIHFLSTLCLILFVSSSCSSQPNSNREKLVENLKQYIEQNYLTPEDYVISKFKEHEVVFLGEQHRIKHDVLLVQNLIPLLHRGGIYYLGTEFARRQDQPLIDSLLNAPEYDENLARLITFLSLVFWGFQEYVDIYKVAWQLNHSLPAESRKFHILGLNDSPDWSFVKTEEDQDKREVMQQVWHGEDEGDWAKVILDNVIAKGEKMLVYCGIHHAFTEYRQPMVWEAAFRGFGDVRVGNHVFNQIGKRCMTVYLHAPWEGAEGYGGKRVLPADGAIDSVLLSIDPRYRRIGFDTRGTPFGQLTGETSVYRHGYQDFTLATFCDGYICQKLFSEYEGVTPIPDFINEANLDYARAQSPNPGFREASVEGFNRGIASDATVMPRIIAKIKKD